MQQQIKNSIIHNKEKEKKKNQNQWHNNRGTYSTLDH